MLERTPHDWSGAHRESPSNRTAAVRVADSVLGVPGTGVILHEAQVLATISDIGFAGMAQHMRPKIKLTGTRRGAGNQVIHGLPDRGCPHSEKNSRRSLSVREAKYRVHNDTPTFFRDEQDMVGGSPPLNRNVAAVPRCPKDIQAETAIPARAGHPRRSLPDRDH
jgi:hypothetical protein